MFVIQDYKSIVQIHGKTTGVQSYDNMTRIKETETSLINCNLHQRSSELEPKGDYIIITLDPSSGDSPAFFKYLDRLTRRRT